MQNFEQEILDMIAEREDTLTEIEKVLFTKRYKLSQKHIEILAVQSITMVYSIWEGFIQQAFQKYIQIINSLGIDFEELSDEIKIFHMEYAFKQFYQYPEKKIAKVKFYTNLQDFYKQKQHNIYPKVNTQSNLGFENINVILSAFCLKNFEEHWEKYKYPEPNLKETMKTFLDYRNGVAHGGDISSQEKVTQAVFEKYKRLVVDLMYAVFEKMQNGISTQSYKKVR